MFSSLTKFLRLSLGAFLLLLSVYIGLPALFLLLQVPSFAIGSDVFGSYAGAIPIAVLEFNLM
jgi:hypothetical protein